MIRPADTRRGLTEREWVVAQALADGLSYKEIAQRLNISFHTVASHVKAVLRKTGETTSRRVAAAIQRERSGGPDH